MSTLTVIILVGAALVAAALELRGRQRAKRKRYRALTTLWLGVALLAMAAVESRALLALVALVVIFKALWEMRESQRGHGRS